MNSKSIPAAPLPVPDALPAAGTMPKPRLGGIDLARALAIIGMLAVHFAPEDVPDLAGRTYALAHGRASILFILLAGIGMSLLASGRLDLLNARLRLFWFAVVLLLLGLVLQVLDHPVAVILHHYAAFYLLGIAVLGLRQRYLLILAMVMTILGPVLYQLGRMIEPEHFARKVVSFTDNPWVVTKGLLVSGPYPLLTWSAPLLWGLWLGRQDLRAQRTRRVMMIGGAVAAIGIAAASVLLLEVLGDPINRFDWRTLFISSAHSQMPLWVAGSTASAIFVLGCSLWVAEHLPGFSRPLVVLGQSALSVYVAHILALYFWKPILTHDSVPEAVLTLGLFTAAAALLALGWRRWFRRGPLESLLHLPWELMDRTLASPPAPAVAARASADPAAAARPRPVSGRT